MSRRFTQLAALEADLALPTDLRSKSGSCRKGRTEASARDDVDAEKRALGQSSPAWWDDGAPDLNRRIFRNTPYAQWFDNLTRDETS